MITANALCINFPEDYHPAISPVLKDHDRLFRVQLGRTNVTKYAINTGDVTPDLYHSSIKTVCVTSSKSWLLRASLDQIIAVVMPKRSSEIRDCGDSTSLPRRISTPVPIQSRGSPTKLAHK